MDGGRRVGRQVLRALHVGGGGDGGGVAQLAVSGGGMLAERELREAEVEVRHKLGGRLSRKL